MKKIIIPLLIVVALFSCKEETVDLYDAPAYISFTTRQVDTIVVSFFLLGNLSEYNYPIEVRHTGIPENSSKLFEVEVVNDLTTMPSDKMSLPAKLEFQPMSKLDTFYLHLTNFAELTSTTKILCLDLKESNDFQLGDRNYRRLYFKINDNVAQPAWWSSRVVSYFLGAYSDAKFRKLMEVVKPDLSDTSESWIRAWALELKVYLAAKAAEGNTVTEDNGDPMTVPVRM